MTGKAPRAWVWPYDAANGTSLAIARQQGYQLAFTLEDGLGTCRSWGTSPSADRRQSLAQGVCQYGQPGSGANPCASCTSISTTFTIPIGPADAKYQQADQVYDMKISHVFLQAFADPQGDGRIGALYFPNRQLPVRADLFNFVSWQLQTRASVKVFAWMPVLSFDLDPALPRVQRRDPLVRPATRRPPIPIFGSLRGTARSRQQVTDLYEDLARLCQLQRGSCSMTMRC